MERPVRGAVVVLPFPFSDLSQAKRRPALVVSARSNAGDSTARVYTSDVLDGFEFDIRWLWQRPLPPTMPIVRRLLGEKQEDGL